MRERAAAQSAQLLVWRHAAIDGDEKHASTIHTEDFTSSESSSSSPLWQSSAQLLVSCARRDELLAGYGRAAARLAADGAAPLLLVLALAHRAHRLLDALVESYGDPSLTDRACVSLCDSEHVQYSPLMFAAFFRDDRGARALLRAGHCALRENALALCALDVARLTYGFPYRTQHSYVTRWADLCGDARGRSPLVPCTQAEFARHCYATSRAHALHVPLPVASERFLDFLVHGTCDVRTDALEMSFAPRDDLRRRALRALRALRVQCARAATDAAAADAVVSEQALFVCATHNMGLGVYAARRIEAREFIGAYVGVLDELAVDCNSDHAFGSEVDVSHLCSGFEAYHMNGRRARNLMTLVNHCAMRDANLLLQWVVFGGSPLLCFFARRDIAEGEQLCYSYYGEQGDEWFASRNTRALAIDPQRLELCAHYYETICRRAEHPTAQRS